MLGRILLDAGLGSRDSAGAGGKDDAALDGLDVD
jgi:hypothetical protein